MNEWVCGNCKSINRAAAGSCYSCGGPKSAVAAPDPRLVSAPSATAGQGAQPITGAPPIVGTPPVGTSAAVAAGPFGFPTVAGPMVDLAPPTPASMSDVVGGLLAGVVAAVLASAIWYGVVAVSHYELGIVAIAVGFIVGQGVVLGARRRASMLLVVISPILTLLALAVSEYLIVAHFVGQELGVPIDVVQPPDFIVSVVTESLAAEPITLAFWAIALFQAVAIPWRSITRWTPTRVPPVPADSSGAPTEASAA